MLKRTLCLLVLLVAVMSTPAIAAVHKPKTPAKRDVHARVVAKRKRQAEQHARLVRESRRAIARGFIQLPSLKQQRDVVHHFGRKSLYIYDATSGRFVRAAHISSANAARVFTTIKDARRSLSKSVVVADEKLTRDPTIGVFTTEPTEPTEPTGPTGSGPSVTPSVVPGNAGSTGSTAPVGSTGVTPTTPSSSPTSGSSSSGATTSSSSGGAPPTVSAPSGFNNSQLIFSDDFSGNSLDTSKWNPYLTSGAALGYAWNSNGSGGSGVSGSGPNYDLEYDLPSQVSVHDGVLDLQANEESTPGIQDGSPYTFGWRSGAVSTYGHFQFDGGYLQVEAKMPGGNGMWPALWLLPGTGTTRAPSGDNYEIDLFEGNYYDYATNNPPQDTFAWHAIQTSSTFGGQSDSGVNLTTGYHTYGLDWVPGKSITWYIDGKQMGTVDSSQFPIPNEPMELIMNLEVASSATTVWRTVPDSSTPSTDDMLISGVQVYN